MARLLTLCVVAVFAVSTVGCGKKADDKGKAATAKTDKKEGKTAANAGKKADAPKAKEAKPADAKPAAPAAAAAAAAAKPADAKPAADAAKAADGAAPAAGKKPAHERMLAHMEAMAAIFEKNAADCGKLAAGLTEFADKNGKDLEALKVEVDKYTEEQKKAAEAGLKTRMQAIMPKIMGGAMKCGKDPKFMEAMKKIQMK